MTELEKIQGSIIEQQDELVRLCKDRILVLEEREVSAYKFHATYLEKLTQKYKEKPEYSLVSNCCASDFDPLGYEKEEGVYQERCMECKKLCEPLFISIRDIDNIRNLKNLEK